MQYCTVQDVEAYYLGKSFKCADWVTNTEVEAFIISESATLDGLLAARYSLPLTNANDLQILKMICEKLVVGTVDDIIREKTADGKFERQRNTRKEAETLIKLITDGALLLQATQLGSAIFFNKTTSDGQEVEKRFKDSNIEPVNTTFDRERHRFT